MNVGKPKEIVIAVPSREPVKVPEPVREPVKVGK